MSAIKFENIYNFRRVIPDSDVKLYRSAALDKATSTDKNLLLNVYDIRTIIDFRNVDEILSGGELRSSYDAQSLYDEFSTALNVKYPRKMLSPRVRYEIPLFSDREKLYECIRKKTIKNDLENVYISWLWMTNGKEYVKYLVQKLEEGGFPLLYSSVLDVSASYICSTLDLILKEIEANRPVLIHCAQGKDRTGIVSMMIELIVNEDKRFNDTIQSITQNYCLTEALLPDDMKNVSIVKNKNYSTNITNIGTTNRGFNAAEKQDSTIVRSSLVGAPASAMIGTISNIIDQYGSINGYFDFIGFNATKRNALKQIFLSVKE